MRVPFTRAGVALLLVLTCAPPAHAVFDLGFGTPAPSLSPAALYPTDSLSATVTAYNSGPSAITTSFRIGLYLERGTTATLIGERVVTASTLAPFASHTSRTVTVTGMIPYGAIAGTADVGVVLDNHDVLAEIDETNNLWLSTVIILTGADLRITTPPTVLSSSTTSTGQQVQLSSFTITNVGSASTAATITGFCFTACIGSPCMMPLPTQWDGIPALARGASYVHPAVSVAIPRDEDMLGLWRMWLNLDPMNDVAEYVENNNRWAADFTMVPTLLDNQDGTITDMNTHLMWMQDANHAGAAMTWAQAVVWAANLVYAGYDDWRLPSGRNPGGSVCDSRISGYDCPNTEFAALYFGWGIHWNAMGPFTHVQYRNYWTATAWPTDPSHAMVQDFDDGGQNDLAAASTAWAWAVRRTGTVDVGREPPTCSRIVGVFPNPARSRATIRFELAGAEAGELGVYDLAGRCVQRVPLAGLSPGPHEVTWTTAGRSPGLYWCRLGVATATTRILVLR